MNSTAAIFARLNNEPAVVYRLGLFENGVTVFNDRAPDDFVFLNSPVIVIAAASSDVDASTLTETIREITQDVRIYAKDTGSTAEVDALARLIRDVFHNRPSEITVDGGICSIATATGPVAAPTTDPSLVGRRVTLRLQLQKD